MGQPVIHWEIEGGDADKLWGFYSDMFDWKIDANNPMKYGMAETGGEGGINGGIYGRTDEPPRGITFYVQVEDLGASLKKAESLGGKKVMDPTSVPGMDITIAMFADPEGNRIGILTPESS